MENDARSLDQKTQAELRRRAHILHKQGKSRQEIADALGFILRPLTAGGPTLGAMALPHCALKSAGARRDANAL
jgi:hypothetical protein